MPEDTPALTEDASIDTPTGPSTTSHQDEPEKLPFFPKRKRFLLPVIILLVMTLLGSMLGIVLGFGSVKRSKPFAAAIQSLRDHPAVGQHVGQPFEPGFIAFGNHDENNGVYDLNFSIKGPKGDAGVTARSKQDAPDAPWQITYLDIGVGGREGQVIRIVGRPEDRPGADPNE